MGQSSSPSLVCQQASFLLSSSGGLDSAGGGAPPSCQQCHRGRQQTLQCKCKPQSNVKSTVAALRNDCSLFSRLYIACQSRDGNLEQFFTHENQAWPSALSKFGELRSGTKSTLISCLTAQWSVVSCVQNVQSENTGTCSLVSESPAATADDIPDISAEALDTIIEESAIQFQDSVVADSIFTDTVLVPIANSAPVVDAKLFDGAALVQMLRPKLTSTFQEYVEVIFLPYIMRHFDSAKRIDIVRDVYRSDSLKSAARERRGCGVQRRVLPSAQIPGNWQSFLRDNENKTELFRFSAEIAVVKTVIPDKILVCSSAEKALSSPGTKDTSFLEPCTQEEADTRLMLHVADCAREGFQRVLIRTTDTDVVVLAVSCVYRTAIKKLWVAFGVGRNCEYIAAHQIAAQLGPKYSTALSAFHAFTGCDCVSFFFERIQTKAWNTWAIYPEVTNAFLMMMEQPDMHPFSENMMKILEIFVTLLYDRTSELHRLDEARRHMFTRGRQLENIPPTSAALHQHTLRTVYQSGHIWGQTTGAGREEKTVDGIQCGLPYRRWRQLAKN